MKKKEVEFRTNLFKAKNRGISREEIQLLMEGLQDGIDYSEARQPCPQYAMDLDSQIERGFFSKKGQKWTLQYMDEDEG